MAQDPIVCSWPDDATEPSTGPSAGHGSPIAGPKAWRSGPVIAGRIPLLQAARPPVLLEGEDVADALRRLEPAGADAVLDAMGTAWPGTSGAPLPRSHG